MLGVMAAPAALADANNSSSLLAASQTGDPDGTGTIDLTFNSDTGEVCFTLSVANIEAPIAAHIHSGVAGSTGPVVVDFGAPVFLDGNACVTTATPAQIQEIVADPASFYVNVHTDEFLAGAVRAQVGALTSIGASSSTTTLMATGDPAGSGSIDLTFDASVPEVCYTLTTSGLSTPISVAHIHVGGPGVDGAVLIDLDYMDGQAEPKCVPATADQINAVLADPNGHYVNVHTEGAPGGAIRGQVAPAMSATSSTSFALDGLGFGDPDGSGTADFTLYDDGGVCFTLTVADIEAPMAAHIHVGADGVQGAVLVDLATPANGLMGCVQSTPEAVAAILADPAGHYVNVHNEPFPLGAIRAQLGEITPAPQHPTEVNVALMATGVPGGSGNAMFDIDTTTGRICYTITVANIDTVTAAHIHVGEAGVDGAVLVNLDTPANGLMGCVVTSSANAMAIVNDLDGHYINVHTAAAPDGAVRSQLAVAAVVPPSVPPAAPVIIAAPLESPVITEAPAAPAAAAPVAPVAPAPVAPAPAAAASAPAAAPAGGLAVTGSDSTLFTGTAFLMIGAGLAATGYSWRRMRRTDED